jgi:hypothetical protein
MKDKTQVAAEGFVLNKVDEGKIQDAVGGLVLLNL